MSFGNIKAKLFPVVPAVVAAGMALVTGADLAGDLLNITTLITFITENFVAILALLSSCTIFLLVVAVKVWRQVFAIVMQLVSYLGGGNKRA